MTSAEIRKHLRAQPFEPFTIHLADGRSIDVPHSEFVFAPPGMRVAVVLHKTHYEYVDLLLVTSLEMKPPSSSAA
jgi:hypothetical protein